MGVTELEKGPASKTRLDVPPAFRNDVLRGKQVIIGCGGGFHQECSQPYSPVAKWMGEVDIALNDEGQQYGNLDESSAIARVPRRGLVVWCGDHKQTPGGLRKSEEARAFRRKLMRRPIALRGDTKFIPAHMLGAIVLPYVQGVPGPQMADLRQLLQESTRQPLALSSTGVEALQEGRPCQKTSARVRPSELAGNKRASQPATNARVSRQQTRESGQKKTIRESPARKRPKEAESPARKRPKEAESPSDTVSFGPLARWPVGPLAFYLGCGFHRIRNPDSGGSGTRIFWVKSHFLF